METRPPVRHRILLVEDDTGTARTLSRLLDEDGYDVEVACDSGEAMDRLDRAPAPDVLVSDFLLPHADGLAVASHARALRPALPVVMITSYAEVLARVERRLDPPAVMLAKPLDYAALMRALKGLLAPA